MAKPVTIEINAEDLASDQIEHLQKVMGDTTDAAKDTGDASEEMGKKQSDASGMAGKLSGSLKALGPAAAAGIAAAGVVAVAGAAKEATAAFGRLVNAGAQYGARIDDLAARTSLSAEQVQGLGVGLRRVGEDMDSTKDIVDTFNERMFEVKEGTGEGAESLKALGVDALDSQESLRDTPEVLNEAIQSISNLDSQSEQTAHAMRLFGEQGAALLPIIREDGASLEQLTRQGEELAGTMSQENAEAAKEFSDNLTQMQIAQEGARNEMASLVFANRDVEGAMDRVVELFQQGTQFIRENKNEFDELIGVLAIGFQASAEEAARVIGVLGGKIVEAGQNADDGRSSFRNLTDTVLGTTVATLEFAQTAGRAAAVVGTFVLPLRVLSLGMLAAGEAAGKTAESVENIQERMDELDVERKAREFEEMHGELDEGQQAMVDYATEAGFVADELGRAAEAETPQMGPVVEDQDQAQRDQERVNRQEEQLEKERQMQRAAQIRLDAMEEQDEIERAQLELQARKVEINARDVEGAQRRLAIRQAEQETAQEIADIEEERTQAFQDRVANLFDWVAGMQEAADAAAEAEEQERLSNEAKREKLSNLQQQREAEGDISDLALARMNRDEQMAELRARDLDALDHAVAKEQILLDFETEKRLIRQQAHQERMNQIKSELQGIDQQVDGLGSLSASLVELQDQGWDFAEANEATVSALGAMTDLGGEVASLITEDRKEAAAIEAAFHAAAAVGATALALSVPGAQGQYAAAAVSHGIAAAQHAAVAGGVGGGSSSGSTPSTAGGGGGGRSGAGRAIRRLEFDRQTEEKTGDEYNFDFSNNTNLGDSEETRRMLTDEIQRELGDRGVA